jgi:hypothetical protein
MEQDNRPIKVQFPSKMNVTSPEIDSINKTASRISNWLHNDLKKIIEPLTVVTFIPDLLKELKQTIVNQFTNLLTGQVESDVINRQANIKVLNKKIDSTQKHIREKEVNLDKTIARVNTRYSNLSEQLNKEHETFLRKLDSHAYELVENIYPNQIQARFSYDSLPGIDFLSQHAMVSVTDRSVCLEKGFNDALKEVSGFMEKRNLFHSDLKTYECRKLEEGEYELPFCFIEFENRNTGETKLECWFEKELEAGEKNPDLDILRKEMEWMADNTSISANQSSQFIHELNSFLNENLQETEKERFETDLQFI